GPGSRLFPPAVQTRSRRRSRQRKRAVADATHPRVALVTGATRGIGRAIARVLGASQLIVIGTATTPEGAASIAAYLKEAGNAGDGVRLDVTDAAAVDAVIADIRKRFGDVSVLVNNAGIT